LTLFHTTFYAFASTNVVKIQELQCDYYHMN
jgi:hypothetical protein